MFTTEAGGQYYLRPPYYSCPFGRIRPGRLTMTVYIIPVDP